MFLMLEEPHDQLLTWQFVFQYTQDTGRFWQKKLSIKIGLSSEAVSRISLKPVIRNLCSFTPQKFGQWKKLKLKKASLVTGWLHCYSPFLTSNPSFECRNWFLRYFTFSRLLILAFVAYSSVPLHMMFVTDPALFSDCNVLLNLGLKL